MVFRYYCRCVTCGFDHTLRISMGHSRVHSHVFSCGECHEEMEIEVTQHPETASCDIVCKTNCETGTEEGLVVNLHPDFPIPADQLHEDKVFPWLEDVRELGKRQLAQLGAEPETLPAYRVLQEDPSKIQTLPERWAIVKKAWNLTNNGRVDLAAEHLAKYRVPAPEETPTLDDAIFNLSGSLIHRANESLFLDAAHLVSDIARHSPEEYQRFVALHETKLRDRHKVEYLSILTEYFRDYSEFSQTLLHCHYNMEIPSAAEASSRAFSRTRMFYGNAYEVITAHFVVLACLNNMHNGRPFDVFESMTLEKYMTINRANRSKAFEATPPFAALADGLNSQLRNASHHRAMQLNAGGRSFRYRSGGTGAQKTMSYVEYLTVCNQLVMKLAAVLQLELVIAH